MSDSGLIIAESGPLIVLARGDVLHVLPAIHRRVVVPQAVADELAAGEGKPGTRLLTENNWIELRTVSRPPDLLLQAQLDPGEAEAIMLAVEIGLPLLVDDRLARSVATHIYRLTTRGTLGLLIEARQRGLIPALGPLLERLVADGWFLAPALIARALETVGEKA